MPNLEKVIQDWIESSQYFYVAQACVVMRKTTQKKLLSKYFVPIKVLEVGKTARKPQYAN